MEFFSSLSEKRGRLISQSRQGWSTITAASRARVEWRGEQASVQPRMVMRKQIHVADTRSPWRYAGLGSADGCGELRQAGLRTASLAAKHSMLTGTSGARWWCDERAVTAEWYAGTLR